MAGTKQLKAAGSSHILRIPNPLEVSTGFCLDSQYCVTGKPSQYLTEDTTLEVAKESIGTHFQREPALLVARDDSRSILYDRIMRGRKTCFA